MGKEEKKKEGTEQKWQVRKRKDALSIRINTDKKKSPQERWGVDKRHQTEEGRGGREGEDDLVVCEPEVLE